MFKKPLVTKETTPTPTGNIGSTIGAANELNHSFGPAMIKGKLKAKKTQAIAEALRASRFQPISRKTRTR